MIGEAPWRLITSKGQAGGCFAERTEGPAGVCRRPCPRCPPSSRRPSSWRPRPYRPSTCAGRCYPPSSARVGGGVLKVRAQGSAVGVVPHRRLRVERVSPPHAGRVKLKRARHAEGACGGLCVAASPRPLRTGAGPTNAKPRNPSAQGCQAWNRFSMRPSPHHAEPEYSYRYKNKTKMYEQNARVYSTLAGVPGHGAPTYANRQVRINSRGSGR